MQRWSSDDTVPSSQLASSMVELEAGSLHAFSSNGSHTLPLWQQQCSAPLCAYAEVVWVLGVV